MNIFENIFCKITIWTYQYFYEVAKKEYNSDGEDTKELAYQYAHDVLANVGFSCVEPETDKRLRVHALDPAAFLTFNKDGKPHLYEFVNEKLTKELGLYLMFAPPDIPDGYLNTNIPRVGIYKFTKPFLENQYQMIHDGELSWEEAFELEATKMTKEELIKKREELVEKEGDLMNKKRMLAEHLTTYRCYIENYKKEIEDQNLNLDIWVCYTPNSLAQQAQANLGFYRNGIRYVREKSMKVTKELRETAREISKIELELGYNSNNGKRM